MLMSGDRRGLRDCEEGRQPWQSSLWRWVGRMHCEHDRSTSRWVSFSNDSYRDTKKIRILRDGSGSTQVHLVPRELLDSLIETLKREYYAKKYPDLSEEELGEAIFSTIPEEGANLYRLQ